MTEPDDTPAAWRRLIVPFSLLALAVLYSALAADLDRFHGVWSADSGARFAMVRGLLEQGDPLTIPADPADPAARLHPLAYYLAREPRGLCVIYPFAFPVLSALLYRALGWGGLTVLPTLCGLGCLWATGAAARRLGLVSASWLPLVMGLATPVLIYSAVFWDVTAQMLLSALAALAMVRALRENRGRCAALAGLALGAGVWLQELSLALFAATVLAALPLPRPVRGRALAGLFAGFAPPVLLWALVNRLVYGVAAGPHLAANLGGSRAAPGHASVWSLYLDPAGIAQRAALQLTGSWTPDAWALIFWGALLGWAALGRGGTRPLPPWRTLALAGLAAVTAALAVRAVVCAAPAVPMDGLFAATPLLAPALAMSWRGGCLWAGPPCPGREPAGELAPWLARACALYSAFVIVFLREPGMDWGDRFLLPALPWLLLLSANTLETWARRTAGFGRGLVMAALTALAAASLFCQVWGATAVRFDVSVAQALNAAALAAPSNEPLVTDQLWLGAKLTAAPGRVPPLLLVRSEEDRQQLPEVLGRTGASGFTYLGSADGLALLAAGAPGGQAPWTAQTPRSCHRGQSGSSRLQPFNRQSFGQIQVEPSIRMDMPIDQRGQGAPVVGL